MAEEEANQNISVKADASNSWSYSSSLKLQETFSSETSARRYIPEDKTLQLIQILKRLTSV
jgi:hypothetical protein